VKQRPLCRIDATLVVRLMGDERTVRLRVRILSDAGGIFVTSAWHEWSFAWWWRARIWSVHRNGVHLGPFQFSHVDLAKLAASEAAFAMKWDDFR
jgi:hypothetical protein